MNSAQAVHPSPSDLVIAVDGPSGSGKSTVASRVANALGWQHLDTGSMYRAVTALVIEAGIDPADEVGTSALLTTITLEPSLNGAGTVTVGERSLGRELRSEAVTNAVSAVSAQRAVRDALVAAQRDIAGAATGLVMEGRDIGTVVMPQAPLKVYLTASEEIRAARRAGQAGPARSTAEVRADQARRDAADSSRPISPLAAATDAIYLDTSALTADQVVAKVLDEWSTVEASATALTPTASQPAPAPPAPAPRVRTDTRRSGAAKDFPAYSPMLVNALRPPSRWLFRAIWKIEVSGREHIPTAGPVLIVGNHAGALDGPFVVAFTKRQVRILAKIELYKGRLGWFLSRVGQIPVDRGRPDRVALHNAIDVLSGGGVLGIFPEGTRGGTGDVRDVRGGAAYLALHASCTIIPVVCTGTSEAFPKGAKRLNRRVPIFIDFGAPIDIHVDGDPRARSSVATATAQIRTGMTNHLEQVRRRRATS